MPWNKATVLRQLRDACRQGLPRAEIRELERMARLYGATWAEIAKAKGLPPRRKGRKR